MLALEEIEERRVAGLCDGLFARRAIPRRREKLAHLLALRQDQVGEQQAAPRRDAVVNHREQIAFALPVQVMNAE